MKLRLQRTFAKSESIRMRIMLASKVILRCRVIDSQGKQYWKAMRTYEVSIIKQYNTCTRYACN